MRYLNNDAAFFAQRPLVHGSIYKFEGQISVFDSRNGGPCYRCLFPEPPSTGSVPKRGKLLTYRALDHQTTAIVVPRAPECPLCGSKPAITTIEAPRYQPVCETMPANSMNESDHPLEITVLAAHQLLTENSADTILIDVREPHELAICRVETAQHIPMRQVPENVSELPRDKHLLIMCHHGSRSRRVTEYLRAQGLSNVTNMNGGIDGWALEIDRDLARY
mgnify:CR=1 FL=1